MALLLEGLGRILDYCNDVFLTIQLSIDIGDEVKGQNRLLTTMVSVYTCTSNRE